MFRKPKKKVATRQPIGGGWEEESSPQKAASQPVKTEPVDDDEDEAPISKPPALLSFDHDEGADADFSLKKDKKMVNKLKRRIKLEDDAEEEARIAEEEEREQEEERRRIEKENQKKKERNERDKYLDRYRNENDKGPRQLSDDEPEIIDELPEDHVENKFSSAFVGIPDSRAIYEAKKKRERMKNGGYIPLDEEKKSQEKVVRQRLVREDENDGSDDEDHGRFYSSKELLRNEEDRRREEQNEFLEQEQGDEIHDPEMDEWEKQQILKAVSRHTIGQMRSEMDENLLRQRSIIESMSRVEDMDMDIDMDVETILKSAPGPANTGGVITIEDIMAKLKLRIGDREEALNARHQEIEKMERTLEENRNMISSIEMDAPTLAQKYAMYQELRIYVRSLLDCLNEKVAEINGISDKRRLAVKARTERLLRRRRRDVQDQYAECSAAASGKSINSVRSGDHAARAAERDARRARRRRQREMSLAGVSHEEGLSSDDEEPQSQQIADSDVIKECLSALDSVFIDARDEFSLLRKVLDRIVDWFALDGKSFQDAYVHLCIPKLCSPYIRIQLSQADILNNGNFSLSAMPWFVDALLAGADHTDVDRESEVIVGIVPMIVEKVVLPFLIDVVNDEWDPMSLRQCANLGTVLGGLSVFPTLTDKSKPLNALLDALKTKITICVDEDLFTPMFGKQAIENPNTGCKSFLDRQFWSAIKLIRCINAFSSFVSAQARFELIVENIVNKVCVLGIQLGCTNDVACERKVRALMTELSPDLCTMGGPNSFRSLSACLNKVAEDMKSAGRDFYRDVRKFSDVLQNRS